MKGLELSRLFYDEAVRPMLRQRFPKLLPRLAAGLVGEGSQCFGFDDAISQDHDWGASVCIWLTEEDYASEGAALQRALTEMESSFHGYPVVWTPGRTGVLETGAFYRKYLGQTHAPETIGAWLRVPSHYLAVASNGAVFEDPLGEFSDVRRELLLGYPEDIRKKRLAKCCMEIAQSGQYNYPRVLSRGDTVAALLAEGEFVRNVGEAVYLLNNRYAPFYKWLHRGLQSLPRLGSTVGEFLRQLTAYPAAPGAEEEYYLAKIARMQQICAALVGELQRQGLSTSEDPFLVEQGLEVHRRIQHAGLRETDPWS